MSLTKELIYTEEELDSLDLAATPEHIAIIPDGNRRWAKKHFVLPEQGHKAGADQLMKIVQAAGELHIKILTFYIFSTENWNRPKREINAQLNLLERYLIDQRQRMVDNGIRFTTIGNLTPFSEKIRQEIRQTIEATSKENKINVVFALNYGGRDEMTRAFREIAEEYRKGNIQQIDEKLIGAHLDTKHLKDPDLLIRTSGELRVSNFLLWQISYSEIYVCEALWPDFTPSHLLNAVKTYQNRERRLGGT